jgi:hypothetical protein
LTRRLPATGLMVVAVPKITLLSRSEYRCFASFVRRLDADLDNFRDLWKMFEEDGGWSVGTSMHRSVTVLLDCLIWRADRSLR